MNTKMGAEAQTLMGNEEGDVKRRLQCDTCSADFSGPSGLYYHEQAIHKGISFKCKECSSRFFKKYDLKIHGQAWHENVRHPCEHCDFKGLHRKDLALHIKIQHDQRRFDCGECEQSFGRAWHRRRHMAVHTGTSYSCSDEECDQSFTHIDNLKRHKKVHNAGAKDETLNDYIEQSIEGVKQTPGGEDGTTIDWVEEIFSPLSETNQHSMSAGEDYSGVNKITYEQSVRGKSPRFEDGSRQVGDDIKKVMKMVQESDELILKSTKKITGSTYWKWRCPECGKQTSSRSGLFKHRQCMHFDEVKLFCDQCEFKTKSKYHLPEHIQRMHGKGSIIKSTKLVNSRVASVRSPSQMQKA